MMTRDELRRLAIRLAEHIDRDGDVYCGECHESDPPYGKSHTPNCPIAALEAEEAALKSPEVGDRYTTGEGDASGGNWLGTSTGGIVKNDDGTSTIMLEGKDWILIDLETSVGEPTRPAWVKLGSFEVKYEQP